MRIRNVFDKILNHPFKIKIVRILCKDPRGRTGRELARELGICPTTAGKLLKDLTDEDIVNLKKAGRSHLYSLKDDNYVVKKILKPFFAKEDDLFNEVTSFLKDGLFGPGTKVVSTAIFGSTAQKSEPPRSDLDLLVVIQDSKYSKRIEAVLDRICNTLAGDFGIAVSPLILSTAQIRKRHKKKAPLISQILKSYILIAGKSLERILV